MDFSKRFKTNLENENGGVWVDIGDGAELQICRKGNSAYRKRFADLVAPFRAQLRTNSLGEKKADALYCQVLAETILTGWRGDTVFYGEQTPYSVEFATKVLADPEMKDFRTLVEELSDERATFQDQDSADVEGN